ncbi:MAG: hypothetical protein CME36_14440 [unclassified Hahellaceae]|nr:hypothetical protein [Hahellaceae bacterium]
MSYTGVPQQRAMKDDTLKGGDIPPVLDVLYIHHSVSNHDSGLPVSGPHEAGKFLNSFFEQSVDAIFASCAADALASIDDAPDLLILALGRADATDCVLVASAATRFPRAALVALISAEESSEQEAQRLIALGVTDVIRYAELQIDLFRHVIYQALRLRQRELELTARAAYSDITGLFSGGLFLDLLAREIAAAVRGNTRLAVFCIEPAEIAPEAVHGEVAIELARRLRELVRTEDLLAQADMTTVLLLQTHVRDVAQCLAFANRLHAALEPYVPVRIGIAGAPEAGTHALTLIKAAKHAVADLRDRHEAGTRLHQPAHGTQLYPHPRVLEAGADLQSIWQRGELSVYFQPVVNRSRLTVVGFECLLRWEHPTRGLISAAAFLNPDDPAMVPVGNWLLRQACKALQAWQVLGWPHLSIAVNTSITELLHPRFSAVLDEAVSSHGLSFQQLILEIRTAELSKVTQGAERGGAPDDAADSDNHRIMDVLNQLDLRGVQIALDNVGAGGSTTELLRRFPASMLKLDPGVISSLGRDAVAAAVVHGAAGIAESLALSLVAEGVENSAQLKHLLNAGVTLLQGNFLHAPMSRQQVTDWLSAQPRPRTRGSLTDNTIGSA